MQKRKPEILFENAGFVVVSKPSGLLSIPDRMQSSKSLKEILSEKYGEIFTVHRLDRGTSGLIIFARNAATHQKLSQLFEEREVEKCYEGLVIGHPETEKGMIESPIMAHPSKNGKMVINQKGKPAITTYETLSNFRHFSRMKFQILTGRTHQIRLHMSHIQHPIVCDELYGNDEPVFLSRYKRNYKLSKNAEEERPLLSRLALHAFSIRFNFEGKEYYFEAPIPKDLLAAFHQLEKLNFR